jgi:hypothetical protein
MKASFLMQCLLVGRDSPNDRQDLVDTIDSFYHDAAVSMSNPWKKENILCLTRFCPLDDISKIRACYFAAKKDETLIHEGQKEDAVDVEIDEHVNEEEQEINVEEMGRVKQSKLETFTLKPPSLSCNKSKEGRERFFDHVCQVAHCQVRAREMWKVSSYLDVEMTEHQASLFNSHPIDNVVGFIMRDSQGKGAKNWLPQRRLNLFCSGIQAHSSWMNSTKRTKTVKDAMELSSILADMHNDKLQDKKEKEARRRQLQAEHLLKIAEKEKKTRKKLEEAMNESILLLAEIDLKGLECISRFKKK